MTKNLRLIYLFAAGYWQSQSQYRLGALLWVINGTISPLIMMFVWLISNQSSLSNAMSNSMIAMYYLLSIIVFRLTQTWLAEDLTESIKEGRFSNYLLKPFSFLTNYLAKDHALKASRVISLTPIIVVIIFFALKYQALNIRLNNLMLFAFLLILGYLINFTLSLIVGLLAFWIEQAYGTFLLLMLLTDILAGILIPLSLMPSSMALIARALPFYAIVGYPIDSLMSSSPNLNYLATSIIWLVILMISARFIFFKAIKNYTAVGI